MLAIFYALASVCFSQDFSFKNASLEIEERIENLLKQLSLEEKLGQMEDVNPPIERLNIPEYNWVNEILHGVVSQTYNTTVYPHCIGMAATFDAPAIEKQGNLSATEARAIYNYTVSQGKGNKRFEGINFFAPNINIFRDPRWGRGQETYGEDPFLTGQMGIAYVTGLQGPNPKFLKVVAGAKHLALHSGPEKIRHQFDAVADVYDLWDTYLPAFRDVIVDGKVGGVMCAYSGAFGQPACANDILEREVLRGNFSYTGYVTSDCDAIADFTNPDGHGLHETQEEAVSDAVLHTTDLECGWFTPNIYRDNLPNAIKQGLITVDDIDVSVRRLLRTKFLVGMFDSNQDKSPYWNITINMLENEEAKAHALRMSREALVLLENKNKTLPIPPQPAKKLAVVGPNANVTDALYGNYNGTSSRPVSILAGLQAKYNASNVYYEEGCNYLNASTEPLADIAARIVSKGDIIVFVGGLNALLEGEEGDGKGNPEWIDSGDRVKIEFPTVQENLLQEIRLQAPAKPIILVIVSGDALGIGWERDNLDAIIQAWYPGQEGGTAIADVIAGDYNPAGRLPITIYAKTADLPAFVDYNMKNRTYRYYTGTPLYQFGYGLSYTTFSYSVPVVSPAGVVPEGTPITVSVNITNTGTVAGEEVAELYVSHPQYKGRKPIRALAGFARVASIAPGATKQVNITVSPRSLSLINDTTGESFQDPAPVIWVGGHLPTNTEEQASAVTLSIDSAYSYPSVPPASPPGKPKKKLPGGIIALIVIVVVVVVVVVVAVVVCVLWKRSKGGFDVVGGGKM